MYKVTEISIWPIDHIVIAVNQDFNQLSLVEFGNHLDYPIITKIIKQSFDFLNFEAFD